MTVQDKTAGASTAFSKMISELTTRIAGFAKSIATLATQKMDKSGNLSDVADVPTAISNLGLMSADDISNALKGKANATGVTTEFKVGAAVDPSSAAQLKQLTDAISQLTQTINTALGGKAPTAGVNTEFQVGTATHDASAVQYKQMLDALGLINQSLSSINQSLNGKAPTGGVATEFQVGAAAVATSAVQLKQLTDAVNAINQALGNKQSKITVSTVDPTAADGQDGDVWIKV